MKQMKQNQAIKFSTLQKKETKTIKLLYIDSLCLFYILFHLSFLVWWLSKTNNISK